LILFVLVKLFLRPDQETTPPAPPAQLPT
jgi:hypothetical protein